MKLILKFILMLLLVGCSSSYTPSEKMLAYKKSMTVEQAILSLQKVIWDVNGFNGICGSRGFWYDENSNMIVYENKISMLAHKRGKQLNKVNQGFDDIVVFEKQYLKYDFELEKITGIHIYNDPLLLPVFPNCNKKNPAEKYFIIDLFSDKLYNLKFVVVENDFDEVMASLVILLPDMPVLMK